MATLLSGTTAGGYEVYHEGNFIPDPGIDAGTLMLFKQSSAPIGWTKDTTHNNKMLRIVSGECVGGGSLKFDSVLSGSIIPSGTSSNTTITISTLPSHTHSIPDNWNVNSYVIHGGWIFCLGTRSTGSTGGDTAHNHNISIEEGFDVDIKYIDVIIAIKT